MDILLVHVAVFAVSAVACLLCLPRAWRIKHPGTRKGLIALLLSVTVWSLGYVGYLLAPTDPLRIASYIGGYVFAFVTVAAWIYFCAAYTGRSPRQAPYRRPLVAAFFLLILLKLTNPIHQLYFTTAWATEPFPHLALQHGVLYWLLLGLSYTVTAVGFFMLFEQFYHTGSDSRPLTVLAGVTGVPVLATVFATEFDWLLPLMYEPPGVAIFAVGTLFVYVRQFEAVQFTGESNDPAVFLDQEDSVRDYNRAAADLFPALRGSIGDPIADTAPAFAAHLDDPGVFALGDGDDRAYYELSVSPFTTGGVTTGRLVTVSDVTEREAYRRQLEQRTEQLEALNRLVRHDIRNDMSVVRGWSEALEPHVDDEGQDALERILRKSDHVIELTETAREFVDSLSGESLEPRPTDLRRHLDAELEAARESFPDAEFRVACEIPAASVQANEMLSSVFRNLLENAVRHNDTETPEIDVDVVETDDSVRVRIADNGPGVPDEQKDRVFGRGEKGLDSPGSGIGLYLVHTLTRQFGGDVWLEDNDPRGAAFVVELPKADS